MSQSPLSVADGNIPPIYFASIVHCREEAVWWRVMTS